MTTSEEWHRCTSNEPAVVYWLPVVRRAGRFAVVAASVQEHPVRQEGDPRPSSTLHVPSRWLLAEVDGEWVVIATGY